MSLHLRNVLLILELINYIHKEVSYSVSEKVHTSVPYETTIIF